MCDESTEVKNEKKITGDNSNVETEPFQRQLVVVEKNKFFTQSLFSI